MTMTASTDADSDISSDEFRHAVGHFATGVTVVTSIDPDFARRGLSAAWDGVEHQPGPTGSPRLAGTLAALECTVEHSLPGGDHEIIVGRVQYAETSGDGGAPLLFWRGSYLSLEGDDPEDCS